MKSYRRSLINGHNEGDDYVPPTPSYLFSEDTQNLEEEKQEEVEILSEEKGGEISIENDATVSEQVTETETNSCDTDNIGDVAVATDEFPSEQESENEVTDVDWEDVVSAIDQQMTRLDWDTERGQRYLITQYGVRSRIKLSDAQLIEFLEYLKSQPTFKVGQTVLFRGMKVVIERLVNKFVAVVRSFDNPKEKAVEVAIAHLSLVF